MRERPSRSDPAKGVLIFRDQPTIVFATICSRKRRSQLANDSVHNALVESWRAAAAWLVGFYLIMPDYVHLFCAPNNEDHQIEEWISFWKRRLRRQLKTPESLLQAHSFHHRLRRDEGYSEKWNYVRMNPVRAGLVSHPDQWPYQGILNELPWWN
jgi:putative transposase